MNIERLTALAVWLEAGAPECNGIENFDMEYTMIKGPTDNWGGCGTSCCIAGAAVQFGRAAEGMKLKEDDDDGSVVYVATAMLQLTDSQAAALFYAYNLPAEHAVPRCDRAFGLRIISPAWAARVIRKFIATGDIDWTGTR